ncbi:MAG TPA: hypothetical protein DIT54_01270 [Lachnospiraceae bacterium]|nr:hypothetical protein [Lachnospiraceae bacterium]
MFDKDLFFSLCEKYNVELSKTANKPMIRDGKEVHAITEEDINRVFAPCQVYFDYSSNQIDANVVSTAFYLTEDFAVAC